MPRFETAPHRSFLSPTAKLSIGSITDPSLTVQAQYNPKEVKVEQLITWNAHKSAGADETDAMTVEFGGMQPQQLTVELFFDGAEHRSFLSAEGSTTVIDQILALKQLASVQNPSSTDVALRSPHHCVVTWGSTGEFPPLQCVIENLVTTYTMFSSSGQVLRATVSLRLKEANRSLKYKRGVADA